MVGILGYGLSARNHRKAWFFDDKSTQKTAGTAALMDRSLVKRLKEPPSSAELVLVRVDNS